VPRDAPLDEHDHACAPTAAVAAHDHLYGAFNSRRARQNVAVIDALQFAVLELDREDARHAGEVRAFLASNETPISGEWVT